MVVELAAVRLLAPWFGTSASVWTNVIGVILAGLALGYLTGGRLAASRRSPTAMLSVALSLAALFVLGLPHIVGPTARSFLPSGVSLHEAAGLVAWGSLATTGLAFLPAAFALGCVGPLAVEALHTRTGVHAGTAGGQVLAASTVGSLAGTFATTHLLVPRLGLVWTFTGAALALGAIAIGFALDARRGEGAGRRVVAGVGALALAVGSLAPAAAARLDIELGPGLGPGVALVAHAESPYQSVRVVEEEREGQRFRQLQVNEGFDSFQSVWRPEPGFFGPGYYYDLFALPLYWESERDGWNVLVLGLGAGSALRVLVGGAPLDERERLVFTGIEIDPVVVALAREHLDLDRSDASEGPRSVRVVSGLDARVALLGFEPFAPGTAAGLDYVILDAYAHQVEIPAHLASVEFFRAVLARLAPGGWLGVNVGGFGFDDPVVTALGATIAEATGRPVLALQVPLSRNYVLFARRDADAPLPPWELSAEPENASFATLRTLASRLAFDGNWESIGAGQGMLLTDDRSPLEQLQARSLRDAQERGDRSQSDRAEAVR